MGGRPVLLAAMFVLVCWDRTLLDCLGGPENPRRYVFVATSRIIHERSCLDEEGNPFSCPEMVPGPPRRIPGTWTDDPGSGSSACTNLDPAEDPTLLPDPDLGEVLFWPFDDGITHPVEACDWADNCGDTTPCVSP